MTSMRSRYWDSLPSRAYKIRRLVRKLRSGAVEPGEREELELLAQRMADAGASFGFDEVSDIGERLATALAAQRNGEEDHTEAMLAACDELDRFIDDMTMEALAMRLRAVLS